MTPVIRLQYAGSQRCASNVVRRRCAVRQHEANRETAPGVTIRNMKWIDASTKTSRLSPHEWLRRVAASPLPHLELLMNTRKRIALTLAIAAPLCLTSAWSAADSKTAMDACVKAFVSTSVPKDRQVAVQTEALATTIITRSRPYSIALTATSSSSGKKLATATCRTDRNGIVIALNGKPVPSLATQVAKASLTTEDK
jgi:hypothetical protein